MNRFINFVVDTFREQIGRPVRLERWVAEHSAEIFPIDLPPQSVDASQSVRWNEFGNGQWQHVRGWGSHSRQGYTSKSACIPALISFGKVSTLNAWQCDISAVDCLSASKSDLSDYTCIDDFAYDRCPRYIGDVSDAGLAANLAHREIRILHEPGTDCFVSHDWDTQLTLANSGGSHHFAAAKYIAARIGTAVPLTGTLYRHSINPEAAALLREEFHMFVINNSATSTNGFFDSMQSARASFNWLNLPFPLHAYRAVLLPKAEKQSHLVAAVLEQAGAFDLGEYFQHLTAAQTRNEGRLAALELASLMMSSSPPPAASRPATISAAIHAATKPSAEDVAHTIHFVEKGPSGMGEAYDSQFCGAYTAHLVCPPGTRMEHLTEDQDAAYIEVAHDDNDCVVIAKMYF